MPVSSSVRAAAFVAAAVALVPLGAWACPAGPPMTSSPSPASSGGDRSDGGSSGGDRRGGSSDTGAAEGGREAAAAGSALGGDDDSGPRRSSEAPQTQNDGPQITAVSKDIGSNAAPVDTQGWTDLDPTPAQNAGGQAQTQNDSSAKGGWTDLSPVPAAQAKTPCDALRAERDRTARELDGLKTEEANARAKLEQDQTNFADAKAGNDAYMIKVNAQIAGWTNQLGSPDPTLRDIARSALDKLIPYAATGTLQPSDIAAFQARIAADQQQVASATAARADKAGELSFLDQQLQACNSQ